MNESPLTFKRSRVFIVELVMLLYALGGNVAHYHMTLLVFSKYSIWIL